MPLQTDEIIWSVSNHRAIVDHYELITLLPQCQAATSFAKTLPLLWYPHAWVNHLLFMQIENPLWIRIIGIIRCIFFLTVIWFIITPIASKLQYNPRIIFVLFLAALGLDELPLLLQVTRPEQTILLSISIAIALTLHADTLIRYKWSKYSAMAVFLCVVLLLYPAHPKAIATLPIMIVCTAVLFYRLTQNRLITAAIMLAIGCFAAMSVSLWIARYDCPHSTLSAKLIAKHSLPLNMLWADPWAFFAICIESFRNALLYDFDIHSYIIEKMDWIPATLSPFPGWFIQINNCANFIAWEIKFSILAIGMWNARLILCRRAISANLPSVLGTMTLMTIVGFMLISGPVRMFYLVALQAPLLLLAALLNMPEYRHFIKPHRLWVRGGYLLMLFAVANMSWLSYRYYPFITTPATRDLALSNHRPILLSAFGYDTRKTFIMDAYVQCGLPPLSEATHLVLDDYTYPVLKHTQQPFSFYYITNIFSHGSKIYDNKQLATLLKEYNSSGIIMDCREVPVSLQPFLSEYDGYCCAIGAKLK